MSSPALRVARSAGRRSYSTGMRVIRAAVVVLLMLQAQSDIDGVWTGTIQAGATQRHLVLHIHSAATGITAALDSLDQKVKGVPATAVHREIADLYLEFKAI